MKNYLIYHFFWQWLHWCTVQWINCKFQVLHNSNLDCQTVNHALSFVNVCCDNFGCILRFLDAVHPNLNLRVIICKEFVRVLLGLVSLRLLLNLRLNSPIKSLILLLGRLVKWKSSVLLLVKVIHRLDRLSWLTATQSQKVISQQVKTTSGLIIDNRLGGRSWISKSQKSHVKAIILRHKCVCRLRLRISNTQRHEPKWIIVLLFLNSLAYRLTYWLIDWLAWTTCNCIENIVIIEDVGGFLFAECVVINLFRLERVFFWFFLGDLLCLLFACVDDNFSLVLVSIFLFGHLIIVVDVHLVWQSDASQVDVHCGLTDWNYLEGFGCFSEWRDWDANFCFSILIPDRL